MAQGRQLPRESERISKVFLCKLLCYESECYLKKKNSKKMFEKNSRETCSTLTSPTEIPAEADGNYVVEMFRNPRKKQDSIKTLPYKRHTPPDNCPDAFPKVPVILCKSYEEVHSQDLMNFCLQPKNPVSIIRGKVSKITSRSSGSIYINTYRPNHALIICRRIIWHDN